MEKYSATRVLKQKIVWIKTHCHMDPVPGTLSHCLRFCRAWCKIKSAAKSCFVFPPLENAMELLKLACSGTQRFAHQHPLYSERSERWFTRRRVFVSTWLLVMLSFRIFLSCACGSRENNMIGFKQMFLKYQCLPNASHFPSRLKHLFFIPPKMPPTKSNTSAFGTTFFCGRWLGF